MADVSCWSLGSQAWRFQPGCWGLSDMGGGVAVRLFFKLARSVLSLDSFILRKLLFSFSHFHPTKV